MPEEDRAEREVDLANLSLSVNMVGITIAIFTFLLFFLSPTSSARNNLVLQLTLGLNVATIFSFAIAGLYNYVLVYSRPAKHAKLATHTRRASSSFALGLFTAYDASLDTLPDRTIRYRVSFGCVPHSFCFGYLSESNTIQRIRRTGSISR